MAEKLKGGKTSDKMINWIWLVISLLCALALWTLLSIMPATARSFPNIFVVFKQISVMIQRGVLWKDISSSLISVSAGYALGFIIALPLAILMAWYNPVRRIIQPWIQFIRNIPPLAYVPLIVIAAGVGRKPQIIVITIATCLILTAVRLGASCALTTLIAAESTGAFAGLGMRIRSLNNNFETAPMLLYIIIIGIIGITVEKLIQLLERKLTGWQEKREI